MCIRDSFNGKPLISRFQGTILYPQMKKKNWKLLYFPHFFSFKIKSELTIMTDDGTKGKAVLESIRKNDRDILFLKNGIDFSTYNEHKLSDRVLKISSAITDYNFITVSRLQKWKRVDRSIEVFHKFHKRYPSSRLIIVGVGEQMEHLLSLVDRLGIESAVLFVGAVNRDEVNYLMSKSNIFLSHYELSNVGNPLWEAFKNRCLVVTLSNGDTESIVKGGINGVISKESEYLNNASILMDIIENGKFDQIRDNGQKELSKFVLSWEERMDLEFKHVQRLLN
nr:glycosyltransferase [Pedobacter panaciterrae]